MREFSPESPRFYQLIIDDIIERGGQLPPHCDAVWLARVATFAHRCCQPSRLLSEADMAEYIGELRFEYE